MLVRSAEQEPEHVPFSNPLHVSVRPDHVMAPEAGMAPPGGQNSMGPSGNDAGMYPANRYPPQR